ncbi:MAG: protein translocase subunit SecD [Beijerinckiaceae bacterium]|nr:protein translocase subunit SecD [Beijerinckiaceae bacterium]
MLRFSLYKTLAILLTCFFGAYLTLPNFLTREQIKAANGVFSIVPTGTIVLGLDLQGGAYVAFEVDKADLVKKEIETLRDDVRRILREAKVSISGGVGMQARGVQVRIPDDADRAKILPKLRELAQPILSGASSQPSMIVAEAGDKLVQLSLTDPGIEDKIRNAVDKARQVFEKRINPDGTLEASVQRQGSDRILVQAPGMTAEEIERRVGGIAKLEFKMVADPGANPAEVETLPSKDGGGQITVERRVLVQGEDLTGADSGFDQRTGEAVINFRFNQKGASQFARVTSDNIGKPFAIVLDGNVISAPVIRSAITGGQGQISGNFTLESATNLATQLRFGALPAKFTVVERRSVGAGLGQDAVEAGKLAALVATVLVVAFTIASYGILGTIAVIALIVNVVLIFGLMSLLHATLTLPGIAGIVLTVGVAVDSNVLVYERVREEQRLGRSAVAALDAGFSRAFATIMDANITTFIAGLVLFVMGSGTVKGFAVTLCLGIVTTVFTAFTLTRLITAWWYRWSKPKTILA